MTDQSNKKVSTFDDHIDGWSEFDATEGITEAQLREAEEEVEKFLTGEINEESGWDIGIFDYPKEDDDSNCPPSSQSALNGPDDDFPFDRVEALERNITRFLDGKRPDCYRW